ncbi:MAG: hypothetical protein V3S07_00080 [Micropepsaceae bacterium]
MREVLKLLSHNSSANIAMLGMALMVLVPVIALAQSDTAVTYNNPDYGFETYFPDAPMMREISYTTKDGSEVPATQFYVERGTDHYFVTIVNLADGPAVDFDAFDHAVEQMRSHGEVRAEVEVAYDPGIPGWQLSVFQPDGRQMRGSVYMYDHTLYLTQAITEPGDFDALRLEQSIVLLNPDGSLVDTGQGNTPVERP